MNEPGQAQQLTYEVLRATWGKQSKEASFRLCIVPPHKWCNANTLDNEYVISGSSPTWPCTVDCQQFLEVNVWRPETSLVIHPALTTGKNESLCSRRTLQFLPPDEPLIKGVPCEAHIQLHNLIKNISWDWYGGWIPNKNPQSSLFFDYPPFWFNFWRERTAPLFLLLSVCLNFGYFKDNSNDGSFDHFWILRTVFVFLGGDLLSGF